MPIAADGLGFSDLSTLWETLIGDPPGINGGSIVEGAETARWL